MLIPNVGMVPFWSRTEPESGLKSTPPPVAVTPVVVNITPTVPKVPPVRLRGMNTDPAFSSTEIDVTAKLSSPLLLSFSVIWTTTDSFPVLVRGESEELPCLSPSLASRTSVMVTRKDSVSSGVLSWGGGGVEG